MNEESDTLGTHSILKGELKIVFDLRPGPEGQVAAVDEILGRLSSAGLFVHEDAPFSCRQLPPAPRGVRVANIEVALEKYPDSS